MSSVVGKWDILVDWFDKGNQLKAGTFNFKSDGTWTYEFGGGLWTQKEELVTWTFTNAKGLTYNGKISSSGMEGTMGYSGATNSNFSAVSVTSTDNSDNQESS